MTLLEEACNHLISYCGHLDYCNDSMLLPALLASGASFASGRLVQSMYQDNMLVKYQIELGRHDDKTPSNQMRLWLARAAGSRHGVGRLAREERSELRPRRLVRPYRNGGSLLGIETSKCSRHGR